MLSVEKEEEITTGYSENVVYTIISFSVAGFTEASEYLCSSLFQFLTVGAVHAVVSGYFSFTMRAQLLSVPGYALVRTFIYRNRFREVSHKGQSTKSTSAQYPWLPSFSTDASVTLFPQSQGSFQILLMIYKVLVFDWRLLICGPNQKSSHTGTWLEVLCWITSLENVCLTWDYDRCGYNISRHSVLELTNLVLWVRARTLKEIGHGNCIVPEARLLTLCSRMQFISLDKTPVNNNSWGKKNPDWRRSFWMKTDPSYDLIFGR